MNTENPCMSHEALCQIRTDDPFLTIEGRGLGSRPLGASRIASNAADSRHSDDARAGAAPAESETGVPPHSPFDLDDLRRLSSAAWHDSHPAFPRLRAAAEALPSWVVDRVLRPAPFTFGRTNPGIFGGNDRWRESRGPLPRTPGCPVHDAYDAWLNAAAAVNIDGSSWRAADEWRSAIRDAAALRYAAWGEVRRARMDLDRRAYRVDATLRRILENPGHVYVIQAEHGGPVKVGRARDPRKRLASIQTGSPHRLRIIGLIVGGAWMERDLHARLADHRMMGEWFEWNEAVRAVLDSHVTWAAAVEPVAA